MSCYQQFPYFLAECDAIRRGGWSLHNAVETLWVSWKATRMLTPEDAGIAFLRMSIAVYYNRQSVTSHKIVFDTDAVSTTTVMSCRVMSLRCFRCSTVLSNLSKRVQTQRFVCSRLHMRIVVWSPWTTSGLPWTSVLSPLYTYLLDKAWDAVNSKAVTPKRRYLSTEQRGVTSQKIAFSCFF
jgi:hypothetical protein